MTIFLKLHTRELYLTNKEQINLLINANLLNMANVILYTTNVCPWCHKAKEFFDENGIKYSEKNVQQNKEYQAELLEKSGQLGVPVITVGEEVVIGFNKERLKKMLGV